MKTIDLTGKNMDYISTVVDYVYKTEGPFHLISKNNYLDIDIDEDFMKGLNSETQTWAKLRDVTEASNNLNKYYITYELMGEPIIYNHETKEWTDNPTFGKLDITKQHLYDTKEQAQADLDKMSDDVMAEDGHDLHVAMVTFDNEDEMKAYGY